MSIEDLDIKDLKFEANEIGQYIKATKANFLWQFTLDNNKTQVELQHSRIKGKRTVLLNGTEISSGSHYTYSYSYSFALGKHYLTLYQMTPELYDLRIDNISFSNLMNRQRNGTKFDRPSNQKNTFGWSVDNDNKGKMSQKEKKEVDDFFGSNNNDNNFDFNANADVNVNDVQGGDGKGDEGFEFDDNKIEGGAGNKMVNPIVAKQRTQMNKKKQESKGMVKEENLIDFGFGNDNSNMDKNKDNNQLQASDKNDLFDMFNGNTIVQNQPQEQSNANTNTNNDFYSLFQPQPHTQAQPQTIPQFDFSSFNPSSTLPQQSPQSPQLNFDFLSK